MSATRNDGGKTRGGKSYTGAAVAVLMLETRFPRIHGDIGCATTWDFPVHYKVVRGASPDNVVRRSAEGLLPLFIEAAREVVAEGAEGITTSCGFLSIFQDEVSAAVGVPCALSSIMQVGLVGRLLPPGRRVGLLTISGSSLTERHLASAGAPVDTPIGTTEGGCEFTRAILDDEGEMDIALACEDNVSAAVDLVREHGDIGALVLECANMAPYAPAIGAAVGLPVYSIESFVSWFQRGLVPREFL
ncbi:MAG: aspartate/glutamate racemase family protein [Alphaproteobacteria bacterium]|nr:aspartate/glutamate racemase family protein [Alphaproteobacteria bacterium]